MYNQKQIYREKTVFVTGHTGFKGSWLCAWLSLLGAKVIGYSKDIPTTPAHFEFLKDNLCSNVTSIIGDVLDREKLRNSLVQFRPEIIFHLAAQPLVQYSYQNPVETYETNVVGTLNILEAIRVNQTLNDCVKAIVNVTTDKCYENREWVWGYRENDPLGGYDPYSASKAASEIVTASFRNSFFNLNNYKKTHNTLIATARAGNVIGGGDWAKDRLIPDIARAVSRGEKVIIRNPMSTRPWQHVLESLNGYLLLGEKLLIGKSEFASAWNFGPNDNGAMITVEEIVKIVKQQWDSTEYIVEKDNSNNSNRSSGSMSGNDIAHEAMLLKLDSSKAITSLKWKNNWSYEQAISKTIEWYKNFYLERKINTFDDLQAFLMASLTKYGDK
ncbi:MAG: CDP-glucose 4,6-dehydratase [Oligoflexia bacterium]|nr:CDP-glucose 4,6-dehydratase [Oligoflexia bacterium]